MKLPGSSDEKSAGLSVGLSYVNDREPGIRRRRRGKGFSYYDSRGVPIQDRTVLDRIRRLAIPPAWKDVWISPSARGHIQATGRDTKQRKQYRYHTAFREARDSTKFEHLIDFATVLPDIRRRVDEDMRRRGLPREKVLATIVRLLETTLIRVGNRDYARQNNSFGLTTLRDDHAVIDGGTLRFDFTGKGGRTWRLKVGDRRIARIVKSCQDLPGQELFQYVHPDGERRTVTSTDVNAYLQEITGRDITAKDFRTWAGTLFCAICLHELGSFETVSAAKKNVRAAIERVAARLGNTPTICRKCYVHPEIVGSYLDGQLSFQIIAEIEGEPRALPSDLEPEELAVLTFLQSGLEGDRRKHGGKSGSRGSAVSPTRQRARAK